MALDYKSNRKLGGGEMGNIDVDANATFQAGQIAAYDSTGAATVATTGSLACGIFKWTKASTIYGIALDESITDAASGGTYTMAHANVSNVRVVDSVAGLLVEDTDYSINATNGVITRIGNDLALGESIVVDYTYERTEADLQAEGKNFFNTNDDTAGSSKITLIQGNWRVYTDQFDTSQAYAVNDSLYIGTGGIFTSASGGTEIDAKVVSIPTAASPWLGVEGDFSI
jgi:hypothetical protein